MIDYSYVRKAKAMDMKKRYDAVKEKEGNLSIQVYENATILPCRKSKEVLWGEGDWLIKKTSILFRQVFVVV